MSLDPHKVVYDCVVYAQALINKDGPAGACLEYARQGRVHLFVSNYILLEIDALPFKIPPRFDVTVEDVELLANEVRRIATVVENVKPLYTHPIDPDDSEYINLALATDSKLIVSRDRHLLNLMDSRRREAKGFRRMFPELMIVPPQVLLQQLRDEDAGEARQ